MRVFADNTGLHSVGRCLDSRATGILDVSGFLQFATQIVFCDQISVGGNSFRFDPGVAETTEAIMSSLLGIGIDRQLLLAKELSPERWESLCMEAATEFADEVRGFLSPDVVEITGLYPELTAVTVPAARIHNLLGENRSADELAERAEIARLGGMASITEYCIAGSSELWHSLRTEYMTRGGWDIDLTRRLEIILRIYANTLIGREFDSIYSPALPRAILFQQSCNIVEEKLRRLVEDTVNKVAPHQLAAPPLGRAFVRASNGDPAKVIESALALRDRARPLRRLLTPLAEKIAAGDEEGTFQLVAKTRELGRLLEEDLGLADRPKFTDALELKFVLGMPSPSVDAKRLVAWIEDRRKRRRVAVLTDLSKTLVFRSSLDREYNRLIRTVVR